MLTWEQFDDYLSRQYGYISIDQGGYPDCFYHCLRTHRSDKSVQDLRNLVSQDIQSKAQDYNLSADVLPTVFNEIYLVQPDLKIDGNVDDVTRYTNLITQNLFAGDLEIGAACYLFNLSIFIFAVDTTTVPLIRLQRHGFGENSLLLCFHQNHYRTATQVAKSKDNQVKVLFHYRGVHFYISLFSSDSRNSFLSQLQTGKDLFSLAVTGRDVYASDEDLDEQFASLSLTSSSTSMKTKSESSKALSMLIRDRIIELDRQQGDFPTTPSQEVVCESPLKNMLQKYVHRMDSFVKFCQQPNNPDIFPESMKEHYRSLQVRDNPFVSTSSSESHAVKYASGDFIVSTEDENNRLLPNYYLNNSVLRATNSILGVVYVIMHTTDEFLASNAVSTAHLIQKGKLFINYRKSFENETIFLGGIPGHHVISELKIEVPAELSKESTKNSCLQQKFGNLKYSEWHKRIEASIRNGNQREVESKFIKALLKQEYYTAQIRNCVSAWLIFLQGTNVYAQDVLGDRTTL